MFVVVSSNTIKKHLKKNINKYNKKKHISIDSKITIKMYNAYTHMYIYAYIDFCSYTFIDRYRLVISTCGTYAFECWMSGDISL